VKLVPFHLSPLRWVRVGTKLPSPHLTLVLSSPIATLVAVLCVFQREPHGFVRVFGGAIPPPCFRDVSGKAVRAPCNSSRMSPEIEPGAFFQASASVNSCPSCKGQLVQTVTHLLKHVLSWSTPLLQTKQIALRSPTGLAGLSPFTLPDLKLRLFPLALVFPLLSLGVSPRSHLLLDAIVFSPPLEQTVRFWLDSGFFTKFPPFRSSGTSHLPLPIFFSLPFFTPCLLCSFSLSMGF